MRAALLLFAILFSCSPARARTDSLRQVADNMRSSDTALPHVYGQLAWAYLAENDTAHTLHYLHKARAAAQQQGYDKALIAACSNIGMYYTRFGLIDSAVQYFTQTLDLAKKTSDIHTASKACMNAAGAYLSQGNYAGAIQYYLAAMQYLEKEGDQPRIAANYHCLGIAYYMLKNYPLSLRYYFSSLATGIRMGRPDTSGYNYNGIGVVYKELKQYDSSLYYLEKAHADAERNHDQYLLSHNLSNTGEVYGLVGRVAEALTTLRRAAALQAQQQDQRGLAETCVLLGNAYLHDNNGPYAKSYFDSARSLATAIGAKDVLKNAWGGLAEVYKQQRNYPASLEAYQQYAALKDTLYTEASTRQIAEMQTRYNTERKEKENLLLQKENALDLLQIARERTQKYVLGATFLFLAIISVVYYNQYRLKQKSVLLKERELRAYAVFQAQEDEKGRLSKELHDGVGALLSLIKLNISSITPDDGNAGLLTRTKVLATDAIKEVRSISHDLMPGILSRAGLHAALDELTASVSNTAGLSIELTYLVSEVLPPALEANVFRIIQEATNNIIKHAEATEEKLHLSVRSTNLLLAISDNGKGFDKNILARISGNGLNNIYSRVGALKGTISIETGKGSGTQINIIVPLNG